MPLWCQNGLLQPDPEAQSGNMARTAKLKVRRKKGGKWFLDGYYIPDPTKPSGFRRHRPEFETKAEGEIELARIKKRNFEEGIEAHRLDYDDRVDATRASAVLKKYKVTMEEAAKFYAAHLEATKRSISFNKLAEEYLGVKKAEIDAGVEGAITPDDYRDIKARYRKFAENFGEKLVEEISSDEIHNWLENLKIEYGITNRRNFRKVLSRIFSYAKPKGYCTANPIREVKVIKPDRRRPPIFTADQVQKLLNEAPSDLVPYIAMGAFAGLRPSEARRLLWSDIRWEDGQIWVNEHGKTGDRYVTMQPNLLLWLQPFRKAQEKVAVPSADRKTSALAKKLFDYTWKQDVLRHSFGTAHVCCFEDLPATAFQMGHSVQTLKTHYLNAIPKSQAAKWWEIKPKADSPDENAIRSTASDSAHGKGLNVPEDRRPVKA